MSRDQYCGQTIVVTAVTLDLTWNYDNKPSVISRRVGGGSSQPYLTFTYDGNGQRVKKYNNITGATALYFGEVYYCLLHAY